MAKAPADGYTLLMAALTSHSITPAETPEAVVAKLNATLNTILADSEVRDRLLAQGAIATYTTAADAAKAIQAEFAQWARSSRTATSRPSEVALFEADGIACDVALDRVRQGQNFAIETAPLRRAVAGGTDAPPAAWPAVKGPTTGQTGAATAPLQSV